MKSLIANIPSCICFGGAIFLLATGIPYGWGWLIFAGLFCCTTIKTSNSVESK